MNDGNGKGREKISYNREAATKKNHTAEKPEENTQCCIDSFLPFADNVE